MQCALDRDKASRARVIPIIVRPCDKKGAPFAHLQALPTDAKAITTWNNQDAAWTDVAASIRRVIEELPLLSVKTPPAALPPVWNIPYPQNPLFTGRKELLTQLATTLQASQPTALSQPQAISGLGGIGKTQLALEYTYRYRQDYQAVLWAQADTRENLTSSYLAIAALLNLPEKSEQESARVIAAMKNWLQRNTNWLLILDNADDLALARDFLPPSPGGQVLLTTRAQATGRFARRLEVDILSTELAALFLLRRAGLLPVEATLEQASEHDRSVARAICEEVGGLPLALDQAGAYIEETGCSLAEYQRLYQHRRADLLAERRGQLVDDHPLPVATTWSLSFAQVEQKNPAAADLLRLCAFLAPDAIPEEMITQGAEHLGPQLAPVGADAYLLNQSIEALRAYSLLRREASHETAPSLSVHRLVQAVLKDQMDEQDRQQWSERAVRAVNAAFPEVEHRTWPQCDRLLPHALLCAELIAQEHMTFPEATRLLNQTGYYLDERARYTEAEPLLVRALQIREQQLGPDHPDTATSLNNLALLYENQGKYAQAELLVVRTLAIYEQQLGPEHPRTAISLTHLGYIYFNQGKYEQAEPLYLRALSIDEKALGPEHPDLATDLNNLAGLYKNQGKYEQAEPLYLRALSIREQQLGPDHPLTAQSLNNLAELYYNQGKYELAEPLYQRALSIDEGALRPLHPTTQAIRANYAYLLRTMGRDAEAAALDQP
jgi:tetratricopeptide (TPR) repeat protein